MSARYAIYYAPSQETRLWRLASAWLGWDPYSGRLLPPLCVRGLPRGELIAMTEAPRRYGFHGTLVAPFELAVSANERSLLQVMAAFAGRRGPAELAMKLAQLKDFLALRPAHPSLGLERLAAACVEAFNPFRAPLSEFDLARRRKGGISARQRVLLERWGYPYVMEEFRFHMTLTGSLDVLSLRAAETALRRLLDEPLRSPLRIDAICLFKQDERGERFKVLERFPLTGAPAA